MPITTLQNTGKIYCSYSYIEKKEKHEYSTSVFRYVSDFTYIPLLLIR